METRKMFEEGMGVARNEASIDELFVTVDTAVHRHQM